MTDRRAFLKTAAMAAGGMYLLPACKAAEAADSSSPFGLQLYTLKDDFPKDPKGVLKQVADYGYTQLEGFEGKQGLFWGMGAKEFQQYVEGLGMKFISSHCDITTNFEQKAAEAASIGMKYLICPYKGPQQSIDNFKRFADEFNKCGKICKQNGIRFAYHNHDYSFKAVDGQIPEDVMLANTDPDLVDFEMDLYWVVTAGVDPLTYLSKHKNRFRLCHVKDRKKGATAAFASCILGNGSIDYASLLKKTRQYGMEYFIIEQEAFEEGSPLECVKADAAYLKKIRF